MQKKELCGINQMDRSDNDISKFMDALERIEVHNHLCLIYETQEDQFAAVIPFMRIGLEKGEKCIYIADENTASAVIDTMHSQGIDVESAINSGALIIATKKEAYLKQGHFDPDWMIEFLKEAVNSAKASGYKALRVTGEMTWMLGGEPGVERLMEYESKLNYFFPNNDILAICQYNHRRFKPEIIIDVIRTHPIVIFGYMVCKNLYYVPPDEFLKPKAQQILFEVDRLLNTIRDRERAENELRESEERYRRLFDTTKDGILLVDKQTGNIIDVNPALIELMGYSGEEFLGKKLRDIGLLESEENYQKIIEKLNEIGFIHYPDVTVETKEGQAIKTEIYIVDRSRLIQCNVRNITERKRAEEEIQKRVEELEDFYSMAVGRELRMIELKKEIEELKEELVKYTKQ